MVVTIVITMVRMMEKPKDKLMRVDQVAGAGFLNCSKSEVYYLIKIGKLRALRIGKVKGIRILQSSAKEFMDKKIEKFQESD